MAKLKKKINPKKLNREGGFSVIPAGNYVVEMVKSEVKKTKAKTGEYLNCQFKVLKGKYKGKVVFKLFNLWNQNEVAVDIAEREFAELCDAIGVHSNISDSKILHGKPVTAKVVVREASGKYSESNDISGFEPAGKGKGKKGKKGNKKPW